VKENEEDPLQNPKAIVKLVTKTGRQSGTDGEDGPAAERKRQVSAVAKLQESKMGHANMRSPRQESTHMRKKNRDEAKVMRRM
jgi:hypothetical protein